MEKLLVYNGKTYNNFSITEHGEIKNISTSHVYKHSVHKSGYCMVYLPMGKRGNVKAIRVHKAVAETFIPNPYNLPIVHHKDGNKQNPNCTNLEWVTEKENIKYHHEEIKKNNKYFNNRKLDVEDVNNIRLYANKKMSYSDIAKMFNVSKTTIANLLTGKYYKEYCQ